MHAIYVTHRYIMLLSVGGCVGMVCFSETLHHVVDPLLISDCICFPSDVNVLFSLILLCLFNQTSWSGDRIMA